MTEGQGQEGLLVATVQPMEIQEEISEILE